MPADVLSAALYARFRSRQEHTFAEKVLSAMRKGFGGHVRNPKSVTMRRDVTIAADRRDGRVGLRQVHGRQRSSPRLGWPVPRRRQFPSAANIAKMASGEPLTDEDRWPWLRAIAAWIAEHRAAGTP